MHYYAALSDVYRKMRAYPNAYSGREAAHLHDALGLALVLAGDSETAAEHFYIASELAPRNASFWAHCEGCPKQRDAEPSGE